MGQFRSKRGINPAHCETELALISAVARLRSYATRDRLSAQVRILDDRALTTVRFYNALFGLPDELFRKVVRAL